MQTNLLTNELRPRGRPKKSLNQYKPTLYEETYSSDKRGRGRPRKDKEQNTYLQYINTNPVYDYIHCLPVPDNNSSQIPYYYDPINNDVYNQSNTLVGTFNNNKTVDFISDSSNNNTVY